MRPRGRWLTVAALVLFLLVSHACVQRASGPPPRLADLVRAYDRDITPYYPFTASELGLRQYDRVLANDIGEEWRNGMQAICARYGDALRRIEPAALTDPERVTYDVLTFRLDVCVAGFRFPWHLTPVNHVGG